LTQKTVIGWSGGKDSALALYEVLKSGLEVQALLTTVTQDDDRVSVHGVRRVLLEQHAEALGLPLEQMLIPAGASNREYERELLTFLRSYRNRGVVSVVFGDISLEDVRRYRDELLAKIGMRGLYPLWKRDTRELANQFINLGFKAVVTVVDGNVLSKDFAGREYNMQFLSDLPAGVDPCGENGEFHSFVFDGPIFRKPVAFARGEVAQRDGRFFYCDLMPI